MKELQSTVKSYILKNIRAKRYMAVLVALSLIVTFAVPYILTQPAASWTGEAVCGFQAHTHSDACFEGAVLKCTQEVHEHSPYVDENNKGCYTRIKCDSVNHVHDINCFNNVSHANNCSLQVHMHQSNCKYEKLCPYEQNHKHGAGCYSCGLEEHSHSEIPCQLVCGQNHSHEDSCYSCRGPNGVWYNTSLKAHTHDATCQLNCTKPESHVCRLDINGDGSCHTNYCTTHNDQCFSCRMIEHSHTVSCYNTDQVTCGKHTDHTRDCYDLEEGHSSHTHGNECYEGMTCGLEEHTHSSTCLVNGNGTNIELIKLLVGANIIGEGANEDIQKLWGITRDQGIELQGIFNNCADDAERTEKLQEYCSSKDINLTLDQVIQNADENFLLGIASRFCVFVEDYYQPSDSDAEGRVAVGGDFIVDADFDYQIGKGPYKKNDSLESKMNNIGFAYLILGGAVTKRGLGDERNDSGNIYKLGNEIGVLEEAARRVVLNHTTGEAVSTAGLIPLDRVYLAKLFDFADEYEKFKDTSKRISGNHTAGVSKAITVETNKQITYQTITEVKDSNNQVTNYTLNNKPYIDPEYKTLTLTYTGTANTSSDTIFFNLSEGDIDGLDEIHFVGVGDANVVINVPDGGTINFGDDGSTIITKFDGREISKQQVTYNEAEWETLTLEQKAERFAATGPSEHHSNNSEDSERILYNFYNANEIILNRNLNGTLLAPNAHIDGGQEAYGTNGGAFEDGNGHLSGAMIARSFDGALEIGFRPYAGNASIAVTKNVTVRKNWANVEPQPIEVTLYQSLGEQYNVTADTVETLLTEGKITKVSESDNIVNPVTIQADSGENGWENTWYNLPQFQTMDDGQTQTPYYYYAIETPTENADWEVDYQNNGISNGVIDVTNHKNISVKVQKEYLNWDGTPIDLKDKNPKPVVQFKLYASTEAHTHVQPNLRNLICAETHTHTPKCYAAHLVCTETSMAHKHKPSCYACHYECEWFEHTHSEECGDTCTIREHTHNEACISCSYLPAEDSLKPVNNESGNNIYTIEYDASGELPLDPEETPILGPNQSLTGGGSSKTAMMTELENLPAIDEKGNKLYYYIEELNADGYDVTYTGNAWNENKDVTITNKQKSIEITVEKNWVGVSPSDMNPVQIQIEQYIQSEDGNITEDLDMPLMFNILADKEYLTVGSTAQIIPVNTKGKDVIYESTNEAVATVDENGMITGVSNGQATIIANCDGQTASLKMEVAVLYPKDVLSNVVTLDSSKVLDSFTLKFTDVMLDKLKQMWENDPDSDNDGRGQYFQNTPIVLNLNGSEVKFGLKYKDSQWYFNMWYSNINGKTYNDATVDHLIENGNLVIDQTFLPEDFKCGNVQITSNLVDLIAYPEWTYASEQSALQKTMRRAAMYRSLLRNITSEDVKLKIKNEYFATLSLGPGNNWTQTLEVPVADFYGNPYYYSAKETSVPDGFVVKYYFEDDDDKFQTFISAVNPGKAEITVTNSKEGSFPVKKQWGDSISNTHTNDKVRINLYKADNAQGQNLVYVKQLELSRRNNWNSQFDGLLATESDGSVIYYYIREIEISLDGGEFVPVENTEYHPEYNINGLPLSGISANAVFTVTNNRTYPEKPLSLTVNKVWHGQASDSIRFTLKQYRKALNEESYSPVEEYSSQTYELSAANDWTITIDDLVGQSTDGAVYKYEVVEEAISGYRTAYTQGAPNYDDWTQSATITNTKYFNLKVLKKWIDRTNNGHNGDSVFFKIFRSVTKPDRDDVNLYEALTITPDAPINMIWGENSILYVNKQVSVKGEYDTDVIDVVISETPDEDGRYSVQVIGKKAGETQLTLTDGLLERTVSVTIENPEMVIVLPEGEDASIQSHDELQLRVEDVSENELHDIIFTSSDEDVATVDENGKVTGGTTSGTATITAKKEGYKDATIAISVGLRSMTVKDSKGNTGEMTLTTGDTETLAAYFGSEELDGVTFTSSKSTVVSVDGNTITAGVPGTATITATKPGYAPVTIQVTVQEIPFEVMYNGQVIEPGSMIEIPKGQQITFTATKDLTAAGSYYQHPIDISSISGKIAVFDTKNVGEAELYFRAGENNYCAFRIKVVESSSGGNETPETPSDMTLTYNGTTYQKDNQNNPIVITQGAEMTLDTNLDINHVNSESDKIQASRNDTRKVWLKGVTSTDGGTVAFVVNSNNTDYRFYVKVEPQQENFYLTDNNGKTYYPNGEAITVTAGSSITLNSNIGFYNPQILNNAGDKISVSSNGNQLTVSGNAATDGNVQFQVTSQNTHQSYQFNVKVVGNTTTTVSSEPSVPEETTTTTVSSGSGGEDVPFTVIRTDTGETLTAGSKISVMQFQEITFTSSRPLKSVAAGWSEFIQIVECSGNTATIIIMKASEQTVKFTDENNQELAITIASTKPNLVIYDQNNNQIRDQDTIDLVIGQPMTFTSNVAITGAGENYNGGNIEILIDTTNPKQFTITAKGTGNQDANQPAQMYIVAATEDRWNIKINAVQSTSYSLRSMSSLVRSMRSSTPVESSVVFTDPVNGIAASNVIKLSAANDWAFDATNLPATDASGNKYYYWVVEYADEACTTEQIRGYTTNYIFWDGDASDAVIDTENLGSDPTVILCNVEKEQTAEMPSTGGRGTAANTFAGMAIMAGSAAGYFVLKRRRHRRSA